jgi:hypothetical protein
MEHQAVQDEISTNLKKYVVSVQGIGGEPKPVN